MRMEDDTPLPVDMQPSGDLRELRGADAVQVLRILPRSAMLAPRKVLSMETMAER